MELTVVIAVLVAASTAFVSNEARALLAWRRAVRPRLAGLQNEKPRTMPGPIGSHFRPFKMGHLH